VTAPDSLIVDALNELAAEAATPRPMADVAWRAGRRRRRTGAGASAAGAAAVTAAAVLVPLIMAAGPASSRHGGPAQPFALATSITFQQVARSGRAPCPAGSDGLPTEPPAQCVYLTGPTVVITRMDSLGLVSAVGESTCKDTLAFRLTPAEGRQAFALSSKLARKLAQMAIIVAGRVIGRPMVQSPFAVKGEIQPAEGSNDCPAKHAWAAQLLHELRSS
jgi:hypothetical protein